MKLCDLALYSPETSSGVRTYIENKMRYISACHQPIEHVLLVPAKKDKFVVRGRSKICYVQGVPCFYPKLRLVANILKVERIIRAEAPDLIELNSQYILFFPVVILSGRLKRLGCAEGFRSVTPISRRLCYSGANFCLREDPYTWGHWGFSWSLPARMGGFFPGGAWLNHPSGDWFARSLRYSTHSYRCVYYPARRAGAWGDA